MLHTSIFKQNTKTCTTQIVWHIYSFQIYSDILPITTNYSNLIVSVGFLRPTTSFIHSYTYCSIKPLQQIKFKHYYVLTCCIPVSSNKIPRTTQHKLGWRCIVISCSLYLVFRHTTHIIHTNYMHTNSNIQFSHVSGRYTNI